MGTLDKMTGKGLEGMKTRADKLALIERLRAMGFSEKEIEYNFSQSDKDLDLSEEEKHSLLKLK